MEKSSIKNPIENRNYGFDLMSGCLIIYMIFCHIMQWAKLADCEIYSILQRFLFFFMAWFFYKSGIYAKQNVDLKKYTLKNYRKLLLPALYFSLIGIPAVWCQTYQSGDTNIVHYTLSIAKSFILRGDMNGNLPLWFLITLFEVKLVYVFLSRKMGGHTIFIAFFMLSGVFSYLNLHEPSYIFPFFTAMTFYSAGHLLVDKENSLLFFSFCVILYITAVLFYPQMVDLRTCTLKYGNYNVWIIVSVAACVTWNNLCKHLVCYVPKAFLQFGRDSMIYYVLHWLAISYSALVLHLFIVDEYGWGYFGALSLMVIVLMTIAVYFLKKNNARSLFGF